MGQSAGARLRPDLGTAFQFSGSRPTPRGFGTALYVAGFSLSTLGTGDLIATAPATRLLMAAQAFIGFGILTLTLTYVMSIYSALQRRNRFALTLHHLTGDTGDAAELLARIGLSADDAAGRQQLATFASGLDELYESHHFYPILHYFFFRDSHYAMARILYVLSDLVSLLRAREEPLGSTAEATALWHSITHALERLAASFLPETSSAPHPTLTQNEAVRWERRWRNAQDRLGSLHTDVLAGRSPADLQSRYVTKRAVWDARTHAFSRYMNHDWDVIAQADRGDSRDGD